MRTIEEIKAAISAVEQLEGSGRYERVKTLNGELLQAITDGISPDRLQEICSAEREGRCVVLPCKVGDTVYLSDFKYNKIIERTVAHIEIDAVQIVHVHFGAGDLCLKPDDFGKIVFLTREEAENAAKGVVTND